MKRFRFKGLLATVLSFALLLSLTLPIASASEISTNAPTATITDDGDLLIVQNGLETRVVASETSEKIVFTEYHNDEIFQEITTYRSQPKTLHIQNFSNNTPTSTYTETISENAVTHSSAIPFASKEFIGTMSGDAWHLHDADKDFRFSVRVWNEVVDSGTTAYTLPNTEKTAAGWASWFVSLALFVMSGSGAMAIVKKLISAGSLVYGAGNLLLPSGDISLSCIYTKNKLTMTPAANDPLYAGKTQYGYGTLYEIKDDRNPSHNGEVYHEGLAVRGSAYLRELGEEIFYHLYNLYEPNGLVWS